MSSDQSGEGGLRVAAGGSLIKEPRMAISISSPVGLRYCHPKEVQENMKHKLYFKSKFALKQSLLKN